ncbi:MAG: YabP/YqfC family sporulation protein, partial [Firmicutes bacterium]|nr:YabP/YqfC family sporulation protein [Bacillota bacterium]
MSLFRPVSLIRYKDLPIIAVTLPSEVRLWSYGVLQEYFPHQISFRTRRYHVTIAGENLFLRAMTREEVLITGKIFS